MMSKGKSETITTAINAYFTVKALILLRHDGLTQNSSLEIITTKQKWHIIFFLEMVHQLTLLFGKKQIQRSYGCLLHALILLFDLKVTPIRA